MKNAMPSDLNLYVKLFVIVLLIACSNKDNNFTPPPGILSQDSMVAILTDVHLVEGAKIGRKIMGDTLTVEHYYHKVYDKHNISKEKFEKSFDFYNHNPAVMDEIYELVIEELNSIEILPAKNLQHNDSLNNKHQAIIDSLEKNVLKKKPSKMGNPSDKDGKNP